MEEAPDLQNDPSIRLGMIMGRMQAITDMMALFAHEAAAEDDIPGQFRDIVQRQFAISRWLDQAKAECDAESELLLAELQAQEREDPARGET
ncbi:MAG: hypothetical protein P0Y52_07775 [Candidatus Brevundimonas phytovorans]|nr:hypothetical protein [Brevundimonas sp.]WEK56456.1 MAG: hypothetical protein P0Y52_07775 [Brevundimonas sp.]